ncbi:general transcription factor II-I repeat domain-containing protein 2-like [Oratosquilla oratoria]|uniref:general transcription factor II-I repeat domain-containing protein 2-like n=1 Tax=Oratosquilla oratoria TaxID=337810 RepID=UPI003F7735D0
MYEPLSHIDFEGQIPFSSPFNMATKKRKVDAEFRVFNEEWGVKYFFVETKDQKASCVICSESVAVLKEYNLRRHYETKHLSTYSKFSGKLRSEKYESMKRCLETHRNLFTRKFAENESVIRTSCKIVHKMAERGKPFTDSNFIKECMMEAANDLCPEKAYLFGSISLSASSVVRRTEELGENIVLQIREKARNLLRYSLALACMEQQLMEEKNMAGVRKDLVGQIRTQLEDLQIPGALFIHCIIHQQALCGKDLDIFCVLKPVVSAVNFIRGHAYHRRFQAFLEEIYFDFCDLPYHTAVRWLSCGKLLFRFYNLRNEIDAFLNEKDRADPQLSDPAWLSKLSFLVDTTSHMNERSLKLQGKDNLVCDLYRIIKGFRRKLSLVEAQLERENFSHFHCFKEFCATIAEDVNLDFPKKIIRDLKEHFLKRFSDLDRIESDILLFQNPFDCNLDDVPVELQMELIDLQAND